jgi:hypothetical protein
MGRFQEENIIAARVLPVAVYVPSRVCKATFFRRSSAAHDTILGHSKEFVLIYA